MFNKKILISLFILFFLTCGSVSAFDLFGESNYEEINVFRIDTGVTNYSSVNPNGADYNSYLYSVFYILDDVPESAKGGKIVTYFYGENGTLLSEENSRSNGYSYEINDTTFSSGSVSGAGFLHLENLTNVSYCVMELVKDDKVVFNITHPFNMSNYEDYEYSDESSLSDNSSSSSDSNDGVTYVASSNSDKFHSESCSQAKRIKDANKITFSSREDAINAGYQPCGICYP